ncbi:MAG: ABC-F family ATP-binding cassette domain-containing protein [Candidatus Jorgensenbacteria bacterium]|nr:ABC-F family ATP-binding cassette domain-containing protein [Candidatus Jorgensenbacteria bacterium]
MIQIRNVSKSYGPRTLFERLTVSIDRGQKFALVGPNGSGKSTLLKILSGTEVPDEGQVTYGDSDCVGYLPQEIAIESNQSILNYVSEYVEHRKGPGTFLPVKHRMLAMMDTCKLSALSTDRSVTSLSGGEKTKIALIAVLLAEPNFLVLDEPTNNIDLPTLLWIEAYLRQTDAGAIVVSHDRRFLERVTNRVMEIDPHTTSVTIRRGTFTDYLHDREKERVRLLQMYEEQRVEVKRLTEQAVRLRAAGEQGSQWVGSDNDKFLRGFKRDRASKSGKKAKVIEKRIEQMEHIERPLENKELQFRLRPDITKGSGDITLEHAITKYPSGFSCGPISFSIPYGSRIVLMGANGAGKSTLLKMISGEIQPASGIIYRGQGIRFGNFSQGHKTLNLKQTPLQLIQEKATVREQDAYAVLSLYGIKAEKTDQLIGLLSPGERARILLALFSALSANVLLLDEPTNHLDIEAQEALETALRNFTGTLALVSHDRLFIDRIGVADIYVMENGKLGRKENLHAYMSQVERISQKMLRVLV